jgi:hypothetical protein
MSKMIPATNSSVTTKPSNISDVLIEDYLWLDQERGSGLTRFHSTLGPVRGTLNRPPFLGLIEAPS